MCKYQVHLDTENKVDALDRQRFRSQIDYSILIKLSFYEENPHYIISAFNSFGIQLLKNLQYGIESTQVRK